MNKQIAADRWMKEAEGELKHLREITFSDDASFSEVEEGVMKIQRLLQKLSHAAKDHRHLWPA